MKPATLAALRAALPEGALSTDTADRVTNGYDNSRQRAIPAAVAWPRTTEQVAALVKACNAHAVPVTARGLGSATTGAAVPRTDAVVVNFERMNAIRAVDASNRVLVAQPGVLNTEIQDTAARHGFFWAPDPTSAPYSTLGGNLACNAAGPRAVKYGTPRENVFGLEAVTGTGTVIRTGVYTTKGVVGYDLTRLLVGSEGTLALITEATLKLTPQQPARGTLRAVYRDFESAAAAVAAVMAGAVTPCALECMDGAALAIVREQGGIELPEPAGAMLLIECDGTAAQLDSDLEDVAARARNDGLVALDAARDAGEIATLWACRRALSPALRNLAPTKINEDVVVPVSRLPALVDGTQSLARRHGVRIVSFGHAGNGNLHVNLLGDAQEPGEAERLRACLDDLFALVMELGGTLSGEHGIGLVKRDFISREIQPAALELMHDIKRAFDPNGILNPGKLLPDE